ncbi:MAG: hypothetical protein R2828_25375 [Saprospiraceae bacterium]
MKKLPFLLAFSILFLLGCKKEEMPQTNSDVIEFRNGNGKQATKPFKATITVYPSGLAKGVFVGFCDNQFGNFNFINNGSGEDKFIIPHMGHISEANTNICLRPYLQDDQEVFPTDLYGPFLESIELFPIPGVVIQEDVATAANGKDKLYIVTTYNTFPDPEDKFHSILEGTFKITGGEGKFEGATGEGTIVGSGSADFINPVFPYIREYDGTITY